MSGTEYCRVEGKRDEDGVQDTTMSCIVVGTLLGCREIERAREGEESEWRDAGCLIPWGSERREWPEMITRDLRGSLDGVGLCTLLATGHSDAFNLPGCPALCFICVAQESPWA